MNPAPEQARYGAGKTPHQNKFGAGQAEIEQLLARSQSMLPDQEVIITVLNEVIAVGNNPCIPDIAESPATVMDSPNKEY